METNSFNIMSIDVYDANGKNRTAWKLKIFKFDLIIIIIFNWNIIFN